LSEKTALASPFTLLTDRRSNFFKLLSVAHYLACMKRFLFLFLLFPAGLCAQQMPGKFATADGIMAEFYACLDVQKGGQIDSARLTELFWPGAQLDGVYKMRKDTTHYGNDRVDIPEYLKIIKEVCATHRFKEWETGRKTMAYGHLMTIYSAYELIDVNAKNDTIHLQGVNTFQLFNDGKRWWITYCSYEEESTAGKTAKEFLEPEKKNKKK
jgi:hypothetical protein